MMLTDERIERLTEGFPDGALRHKAIMMLRRVRKEYQEIIPAEMLPVLLKSVNNSIGEITASYQVYWLGADEDDNGITRDMENDKDLNALIDAKRWLETQVSKSETEPEI